MRKPLILIAVMALMAPAASADMILVLDDTSTVAIDVIIADGQAAGYVTSIGATTHADSVAAAGWITYAGSIGNWIVNVATGLSKPILGPLPRMHLDSVDATSAAGGQIIVALTDTGFGPFSMPSTKLRE